MLQGLQEEGGGRVQPRAQGLGWHRRAARGTWKPNTTVLCCLMGAVLQAIFWWSLAGSPQCLDTEMGWEVEISGMGEP